MRRRVRGGSEVNWQTLELMFLPNRIRLTRKGNKSGTRRVFVYLFEFNALDLL